MFRDLSEFLAWVDSLDDLGVCLNDAVCCNCLCHTIIKIGNRACAGNDEAIAQLLAMYAERLIHFCDCEPVIVPCERPKCVERGKQNVCKHSRVTWDHCPHVPPQKGNYFGWGATALVLSFVDPEAYRDPGPADERREENLVTSHAAKVEVLAARAHRGVRLYHCKDMGTKRPEVRTWDEREERIGRKAVHLANGQPVKNVPLRNADGPAPRLFDADDPRIRFLEDRGYELSI